MSQASVYLYIFCYILTEYSKKNFFADKEYAAVYQKLKEIIPDELSETFNYWYNITRNWHVFSDENKKNSMVLLEPNKEGLLRGFSAENLSCLLF